MSKKKLVCLICVLFTAVDALFAQNIQISGTVTDAEDGSPVYSAFVSVKNAQNSVVTDYTWGNLWEYTEYIPYRTICSTYPDAPNVNTQATDNGLYYDGFPAITEKAAFVKNNNLAGMALWSVDSDSRDETKSLMKKINTELGN
ncbi:MAG: hypothetical protein LBR48_03070 [Dysgonamonadaceae bacterium]|jgi:GH18 family chitinase|nr:hypothetical protein [Dysgonamonadaceae bacterium]